MGTSAISFFNPSAFPRSIVAIVIPPSLFNSRTVAITGAGNRSRRFSSGKAGGLGVAMEVSKFEAAAHQKDECGWTRL